MSLGEDITDEKPVSLTDDYELVVPHEKGVDIFSLFSCSKLVIISFTCMCCIWHIYIYILLSSYMVKHCEISHQL